MIHKFKSLHFIEARKEILRVLDTTVKHFLHKKPNWTQRLQFTLSKWNKKKSLAFLNKFLGNSKIFINFVKLNNWSTVVIKFNPSYFQIWSSRDYCPLFDDLMNLRVFIPLGLIRDEFTSNIYFQAHFKEVLPGCPKASSRNKCLHFTCPGLLKSLLFKKKLLFHRQKYFLAGSCLNVCVNQTMMFSWSVVFPIQFFVQK